MKTRPVIEKIIMISFAIVVLAVLSIFTVTIARAQAGQGQVVRTTDSSTAGWAFLAAAVSTGLGCVGAGIAVAYVGAAAVGAVGEKPEVAGRTLIFVGLAEGIAIYGLIIAIMILGKV
ncbi:MAG: ATP synthase subunit C [Candidatus Eisenbacteria bacterium]